MNVKNLIKKPIIKMLSASYLKKLRKGITKKDFTIICNDCCGGVIYHRIGKKFSSPFINLFINHDDFLLLLSNFQNYMEKDLKKDETLSDYPVGILGEQHPIKIHFLHYKSFDQAKESWERRKTRIINDRQIVIFNLSNSLDEGYVDQYVTKLEKMNIDNYIVLSRFNSMNKNVIRIDFSDLKEFHNAQILAPEKKSYKLHIDQIDYKKIFKRFDTKN